MMMHGMMGSGMGWALDIAAIVVLALLLLLAGALVKYLFFR